MKTHSEKHLKDTPLKEALKFLSEYSVLLFGSGSTCMRMDKNVRRIASSMGMGMEYSILPRHIHITLEKDGEQYTSVVAIRELPPSFAIISNLSKLSWQMADHQLSFHGAKRTMDRIARTERVYPWLLMILVALANACFCGLFAGDLMAMTVVFCAALVGFAVKTQLGKWKSDFRINVIVAAFVSTIIAAFGMRFVSSATPDVAISTCILYLVPGIPFINSFCDLIDRHYLCSLGRMLNALVIMGCLSLGLLAGMMAMHVSMF